MKKKKTLLLLLVLWVMLIWINSLFPGDLSSSQSGFVTKVVSTLFSVIHISLDSDTLHQIIRILAHFMEYFVLGVLTYFNMKSIHIEKYLFIILICLIPIIDEVIQIFVPDRAFEWFDLMIDLLGIMLGLLMTHLFSYFLLKRDRLS